MDARAWTGDDDRDDLGTAPQCDLCACELYPAERGYGRCLRCSDVAADYAAELQAVHGKDAA